MRRREVSAGLTVQAIAGTYVVLLGLDLSAKKRGGCLGFAIQREDKTEKEIVWMKGMKTFEATEPHGLGPGGQVSTREHPLQSFLWADYAAHPGYSYSYTVVPLYGTPQHLTEGDAVSVAIRTEKETGSRHSVFFNRGAVASQEYARRFQNQTPSDAGPAAYDWLSRGLVEALLAFISRAKNATFSLSGAIYEFQWPSVLAGIKGASNAGAKVKIVFDDIRGGSGPSDRNRSAIEDNHVKGLCVPRTEGRIMHNKFLVLSEKNRPIAVWTGSTNVTENGIYGHLNCGHIVEDPEVARQYLEYWDLLRSDPMSADIRDWAEENNLSPPNPWNADTSVVFSPHKGLSVLEWYSQLAGSAKKALFMSFAFGMAKLFQDVYENSDKVLRVALMDKEGNGAGLAQAKKDIRRIRALPNVVVAIGRSISLDSFDRWLKERAGLPAARVRWVHTKFMLVDPLGVNPIVVTGSANFSDPSTRTNDENMLVIRNDERVADIYLGEFMRTYSHYAFREAVAIAQEKGEDWQPNFLIPTAKWQARYFGKGDGELRRQYFSS